MPVLVRPFASGPSPQTAGDWRALGLPLDGVSRALAGAPSGEHDRMTATPAESTAEEVVREYVRRYAMIADDLSPDDARQRLAVLTQYQARIDELSTEDHRALLHYCGWVLSRMVQDHAAATGRDVLAQWDHDLALVNAGRGVHEMEQWLHDQDGSGGNG